MQCFEILGSIAAALNARLSVKIWQCQWDVKCRSVTLGHYYQVMPTYKNLISSLHLRFGHLRLYISASPL